MKAITLHNLRKSFTLLSVILFSAIIFSSCEKAEDDYNSKSTVKDSRTEMVLVNDKEWKMMDGQMTALLTSVVYNDDQKYASIKVYSDESNNAKNVGDYIWVEMPNSDYSFIVEDSKIYVQTRENNPSVEHFLIEVKNI